MDLKYQNVQHLNLVSPPRRYKIATFESNQNDQKKETILSNKANSLTGVKSNSIRLDSELKGIGIVNTRLSLSNQIDIKDIIQKENKPSSFQKIVDFILNPELEIKLHLKLSFINSLFIFSFPMIGVLFFSRLLLFNSKLNRNLSAEELIVILFTLFSGSIISYNYRYYQNNYKIKPKISFLNSLPWAHIPFFLIDLLYLHHYILSTCITLGSCISIVDVEQRKKLAQTEIGDILKLIKESIEECIGNQRNLTKFLKNFFSEMDTDKSGTIDRNEFKKAMKKLKIPIGNDEVEYIFLVYDPNKNGLDYQEFLDLLSLG